MLAARTIQRGAWIAPANQELLNVVGFTPAIRYNRRLDLLQSHINLLWREPHGVVALSALTLSDDPDLQPIGTRRLLSLLRRLALRYGNEYVFEPNSDTFRRQVERRYETILELLFQRGAFAGRTASQSFQLQVSDTPQRIDLGQLLVEIKVAPARPLVFLTVRLVQTGDRIQLQEGR
jgi:phage tail sheath protein FI